MICVEIVNMDGCILHLKFDPPYFSLMHRIESQLEARWQIPKACQILLMEDTTMADETLALRVRESGGPVSLTLVISLSKVLDDLENPRCSHSTVMSLCDIAMLGLPAAPAVIPAVCKVLNGRDHFCAVAALHVLRQIVLPGDEVVIAALSKFITSCVKQHRVGSKLEKH